MTKRFSTLCLVASCVILGACLNALFARDNAPNPWRSLVKSYAEANLELAQARLAQAQSENQNVKGSVSQAMLGELEAGVQVAQERLKQLDGNRAEPYAPQIKAAEDAVSGLEADHTESLKANQLQAGAVPDIELRREQAEIAVAKARLAALKSLAQQPPDVQIRWQIDQLQDDIRALWARPLIED
jgi:hypothetical protein